MNGHFFHGFVDQCIPIVSLGAAFIGIRLRHFS